MISPKMELQWMNVKKEQVKTGSAFDLFKDCSHRVMRIKNGLQEILFSPGELKITDWRGWTDVRCIRKVEDLFPRWIQINAGNQFIVVSHDEPIPVYIDTTPQPGFHGASRFNYQLKPAHLIDGTIEFLRVRRGYIDMMEAEFIHPNIIIGSEEDSRFGYEICTVSGFFNCNNIHIFGSDEVPKKMEVSR